MRKYKATVIVIIMVMLIPFMQSCLDDYDDDIYDMQAGMPFNAALATVVTPSEIPGEAMIESDNDGVAYVVNPDKLTRFETNNPGQRMLLHHYRFLSLLHRVFRWGSLRLLKRR